MSLARDIVRSGLQCTMLFLNWRTQKCGLWLIRAHVMTAATAGRHKLLDS